MILCPKTRREAARRHDKTRQGRTRQDKTRHGMTRQDKTRPDKVTPKQGNTKTTPQDKTILRQHPDQTA